MIRVFLSSMVGLFSSYDHCLTTHFQVKDFRTKIRYLRYMYIYPFCFDTIKLSLPSSCKFSLLHWSTFDLPLFFLFSRVFGRWYLWAALNRISQRYNTEFWLRKNSTRSLDFQPLALQFSLLQGELWQWKIQAYFPQLLQYLSYSLKQLTHINSYSF